RSPPVVFFSRYADLRGLHSFPTRRSSDLGACRPPPLALTRPRGPRRTEAGRGRRLPQRRPQHPAGHTRRRDLDSSRRPRPASVRSEEHTSELQSQSNLVCRLLLEKKKNNI